MSAAALATAHRPSVTPPAGAMAAVAFRPFVAGDVVQLRLQPSQHVTLGFAKPVHSLEDGRELETLGPAWTAIAANGRILCCYGFGIQFPASPRTGGHALAWAMLAAGLGGDHLAVTRFARKTLAESPLTRIEAIVRADVAAEVRWAETVGFSRAALLRSWGPAGEDHLLFERVKPFTAAPVGS